MNCIYHNSQLKKMPKVDQIIKKPKLKYKAARVKKEV